MEDGNRKLYPLRFVDEGADVSWGHVCYHIADLGFKDSMIVNGWFSGNTLSELMGTYMERVTGDDAFEYYGLQFPLLVKVMDVSHWQPLQVNAGDRTAEERYDSFGKTALWYILESGEDSTLCLGFNREVEAASFYERCLEGRPGEVLNYIHPSKGDVFVIQPGTVYAAGPGLKVLEIAECSELSFNLCDLDQEAGPSEDLLLEEAFDIIDFHAYVPVPPPSREGEGPQRLLARYPEFTVTELDLKDPLRIYSDQPGSFAAYHCLKGSASVQVPDAEPCHLDEGQTVLVPSENHDFILAPAAPGTVLLEAMVEKRTVVDSYTGSEGSQGQAPEAETTPHSHVRTWN